jgi:two-component system, OmpR family, alkaline phosphatase synthesis response regulator PhoP
MKATDEFAGSRILVVDDEESLAIGLEFNLTREGYQVVCAMNGRQALEVFEGQKFDLVILDIMLPYLDGFELAQRMRHVSPQLPILFLTARKEAQDRIQGLRLGADDYMTKPFHLDELLLRVRGMLRRKAWYRPTEAVPMIYRFGRNEINFENLSCRSGRRKFRLTPQEAEALRYLIAHSGKIVSRKELLENVWHLHGDSETRTIDNFMVRLRRYFEVDPSNPVYLKSVRGAGYLFNADLSKSSSSPVRE